MLLLSLLIQGLVGLICIVLHVYFHIYAIFFVDYLRNRYGRQGGLAGLFGEIFYDVQAEHILGWKVFAFKKLLKGTCL